MQLLNTGALNLSLGQGYRFKAAVVIVESASAESNIVSALPWLSEFPLNEQVLPNRSIYDNSLSATIIGNDFLSR
jgi:hypothetical protein